MKQPLVSVIIPFYSGANWLNEALLSVQKQTYRNMEVLVINDGSVEDISDIIDKYDLNVKRQGSYCKMKKSAAYTIFSAASRANASVRSLAAITASKTLARKPLFSKALIP